MFDIFFIVLPFWKNKGGWDTQGRCACKILFFFIVVSINTNRARVGHLEGAEKRRTQTCRTSSRLAVSRSAFSVSRSCERDAAGRRESPTCRHDADSGGARDISRLQQLRPAVTSSSPVQCPRTHCHCRHHRTSTIKSTRLPDAATRHQNGILRSIGDTRPPPRRSAVVDCSLLVTAHLRRNPFALPMMMMMMMKFCVTRRDWIWFRIRTCRFWF